MPTLNLTLPDEAIQLVRDRIGNGQFADENEVVYEAIRQMDERAYEVKLQELREALAEGVRQAQVGEYGPFTLEDLEREIESESGMEL